MNNFFSSLKKMEDFEESTDSSSDSKELREKEEKKRTVALDTYSSTKQQLLLVTCSHEDLGKLGPFRLENRQPCELRILLLQA